MVVLAQSNPRPRLDPGIALSLVLHVGIVAVLLLGGWNKPLELPVAPVITISWEPGQPETPPVTETTTPSLPAPDTSNETPEVPPVDGPPVSSPRPVEQPGDVVAPPGDHTPVIPALKAPPAPIATADDTPIRNPRTEVTKPETPPATDPADAGVPALTAVELAGVRIAVGTCWNLATASSAALQTTVTVLIDMAPDGHARAVTLLSSNGASPAATNDAFELARRAVLRCAGNTKRPLPAARYDAWKQIEMTFDPAKMR